MRTDSVPLIPKPEFAAELRIGIVASSFYAEEIDTLIAGAKAALEEGGVKPENITVHMVPGSFEVPLIGSALAEAKSVDALIGLGIIIEGETHHADLLASESARGIMDTQLRFGLPFAFEILYGDTLDQIRRRLDKGREAAVAVLQTLVKLREIHS